MNNEPMSDEDIAQIRAMIQQPEKYREKHHARFLERALAEIDRLREGRGQDRLKVALAVLNLQIEASNEKARADRAEAALARVKARHAESASFVDRRLTVCDHCRTAYPCATIREIEGATDE